MSRADIECVEHLMGALGITGIDEVMNMFLNRIMIGSVIIGFAIGYGSMASSAVQTIPSALCKSDAWEIDCGIAGGTWVSAGVNHVYIDGEGYAALVAPIELDLIRYSWTGTRTEQAAPAQFQTGSFELTLSSPVMSNNPSQWDYYTLSIYVGAADLGKFSIHGVGVVSN